MKKLSSKLFDKSQINDLDKIKGGVGTPTSGTQGYSSDCVLETDCSDGGCGADVMRGDCCSVKGYSTYMA